MLPLRRYQEPQPGYRLEAAICAVDNSEIWCVPKPAIASEDNAATSAVSMARQLRRG